MSVVTRMLKVTLIGRLTDGLVLVVEHADESQRWLVNTAEVIFKQIVSGQKTQIDNSDYRIQYLIHKQVCFLTLCNPSYRADLVDNYLEGLKCAFEDAYDNEDQIRTAAKSDPFMKFKSTMTSIRTRFENNDCMINIEKLSHELSGVHQIMARNVQEVLGVGEKLDSVSKMSSRLTSESRVYARKAKDLNHQALIRKWAPVSVVLGVVFLLFWVKSKLW